MQKQKTMLLRIVCTVASLLIVVLVCYRSALMNEAPSQEGVYFLIELSGGY